MREDAGLERYEQARRERASELARREEKKRTDELGEGHPGKQHHVHLPRRTMRSVLEAVRQVGSSLARYRQLVAAGRHVFVSQPSPAYLRSIGQQRGSAQAG